MKVIKRTKKWLYVELGERDCDDIWASTDLIRVERDLIGDDYSLTDAVKCDGNYQEIIYPTGEWVEQTHLGYKFKLPNNIDDIVDKYIN